MLGAAVYDLYRNIGLLSQHDMSAIAVGFVAAFLSALVVVRAVLRFVANHTYRVFAWYRIALGLVVAGMETVLAWFSKGIDLDVLLVVGLSMLVCTVLGGIIGVLLPFVARRIGTDPATLSSPLITSIMDLVGVFIYFAFAYAFLGDLLRQAG